MADSTNFLPTRESELVTWANNFNAKIKANPTQYGLTAGMATAFETLHTAWNTAYQTAKDPDTNSKSNTAAKNSAKEAMVDGEGGIRALARTVQGFAAITPELLTELGLTVRDTEPSPIPAPSTAPVLTVVSRFNRTVKIKLKDAANPDNRGRPDGVDGALVFAHVGENPPVGMDNWSLKANATKTTVDITFPDSVPASAKVWITAYWYNPRGASGPACAPVSTNIDSVASMAA
jgi:hypothetical protein